MKITLPIDTEVKYSSGTRFKITITSDVKLRIKIPRDCNNNIERQWIERCKEITKYFQLNPCSKTLRGETKGSVSPFHIHTGKNKELSFIITGTQVSTDTGEHKCVN